MEKQRIDLEFIIRTSKKLLFNRISTPSGLSEWFADNVNLRGDKYIFIWDGAEEVAEVLAKKNNDYIRFKWEEDEEEGTYFELKIHEDPITKEIALLVTDFCDEDEQEETELLWENQVSDLKQAIGS